MGKYLAAAACAAFAIGLYSALPLATETRPHSYITLEAGDPAAVKTDYRQETTTQGVDGGSGDHDVAMGSGALREGMEGLGFAPEEVDAYLAAGHHMTWALWHAYTHQAAGEADLEDFVAYTEENQAWIDEVIDAYGLDKEEAPNTGDLPGGAYIGEVPVQPGADAYQLLMDHFGGVQPDWYGGAYMTDRGALMVLLVDELDPGNKTLELEVLKAVGDLPVGFTSAKYSRNDLERMNGELLALLDGKGIPATWGIYDDQNRIVLDVSQPLPEDILTAIAGIDPDDDAILIRVVGENAAVTPDLMKGPPPIEPVGAPAVPGGVAEPQEKRPAAVRDLPGEKEVPAEYDLLPLETE